MPTRPVPLNISDDCNARIKCLRRGKLLTESPDATYSDNEIALLYEAIDLVALHFLNRSLHIPLNKLSHISDNYPKKEDSQ